MEKNTIWFLEPALLWLIIVPLLIFLAALWRCVARRRDIKRLKQFRILPVKEKYRFFGVIWFWFCVSFATAFLVVALARPEVLVEIHNTNAGDFVVIQDGSASMYTKDISPSRWQRSLMFIRTFAELLHWKGDRVALALFAHRAMPQVRLTTDPNVLLFFLEHLRETSPFLLKDDPTWDTNIAEGIRWGLKLLNKDAELYGKNRNPQALLLISDGQAWSGELEIALADVKKQKIPIYVVGVGTIFGGKIPESEKYSDDHLTIQASIDRDALQKIAQESGGKYFELGKESDAFIARQIIHKVQNTGERNTNRHEEKVYHEIYWHFLLATAGFLGLGLVIYR